MMTTISKYVDDDGEITIEWASESLRFGLSFSELGDFISWHFATKDETDSDEIDLPLKWVQSEKLRETLNEVSLTTVYIPPENEG